MAYSEQGVMGRAGGKETTIVEGTGHWRRHIISRLGFGSIQKNKISYCVYR